MAGDRRIALKSLPGEQLRCIQRPHIHAASSQKVSRRHVGSLTRGHNERSSPPLTASLTETLDSFSPNQTSDAGTLQFPIGMNESHHFTAHYDGVLQRSVLQGYLPAQRRQPRLLFLLLLVFSNTRELVKARSSVDGRARTN